MNAALKKKAAGPLAQPLQEAVQGWLAETAVGRSATVSGRELAGTRIEFEIAEVTDSGDHPRRGLAGGRLLELRADKLHVGTQLLQAHRGGLGGACETLADAPEVFAGQGADLPGRFLLAETQVQIAARHAPMAGVQPIRQPAGPAPKPRHPLERQRLDHCHHRPGQQIKRRFHRSIKADSAHAVLEVAAAAEDLDFHAHEVDRQVAAVQFRKADRVFLGRDNGFGLPFLASVDGV